MVTTLDNDLTTESVSVSISSVAHRSKEMPQVIHTEEVAEQYRYVTFLRSLVVNYYKIFMLM